MASVLEESAGDRLANNNDQRRIVAVPQGTTLSKLMAEYNFRAAIKRAEEHPEEVQVWIADIAPVSTLDDEGNLSINNTRRRRRPRRGRRRGSWPNVEKDQSDSSTQQQILPLHQACALFRSVDHKDKRTLEDVIGTLISIFPEACGKRDTNGVLPLYRILIHHPSIELVVQMIAAYPDALLEEEDEFATEDVMIWSHARHDGMYSSKILELLEIGKRMVRQTRHEAGLRFLVEAQQRLGLKDFVGSADVPNLYLVKYESIQESYDLQDENADLKKRVLELEMILRDHGINRDGNEYSSGSDNNGEMMSVMGMDPEKPSALTKYMENKVMELQEDYEEMEVENERLIARVEELQSMLNNLERKHFENSVHSSSDVSSVRSKVLSMHEADSPGDTSAPPLSMHETPASTPDASRDGDDCSDDQLSDLMEQNRALEERNLSLEKEGQELREALKKMSADKNSSISESAAEEIQSLKRQIAELSETAFKREELLRQQITAFQTELVKGQEENQKLRERQNELIESLRLEPTSSQHDSIDDAIESQHSHDDSSDSPKSPISENGEIADQLSDHQDSGTTDKESDSHASLSSSASIAVSLAHSSAVSSRQSMLGSEMLASKGSNSITRSFGHSSSSRTVSNGSTTSWTILSLTQQPAKRKGRRQRNLRQLVDILPEGGNLIDTFHDSFDDLARTFFHDDLNAIFKTAAAFYHDFGTSEVGTKQRHNKIGKTRSQDSAKPLPQQKNSKRRYSDGGASPLVEIRKALPTIVQPRDTLQQTALILAAEEDLSEIVRRSQEVLGRALPASLVASLQEASFQIMRRPSTLMQKHVVPMKILDRTLTKLAETLHEHDIPDSITMALLSSSQVLLASCDDEHLGMERMKERLEQEFLDTLVGTAGAHLGKPLPVELVDSLRTASASFGNLLHETVDDQYSIRIDFRILDTLFKKAQRMYGRKFPKQITTALREASFVLQSRLEGTDFFDAAVQPLRMDGNDPIQLTEELPPSMHRSESALNARRKEEHLTRSKSVDRVLGSKGVRSDPTSFDLVQDISIKVGGGSTDTHYLNIEAGHEAFAGTLKKSDDQNDIDRDTTEWSRTSDDDNGVIETNCTHMSERSLDLAGVFDASSSNEGEERNHRSPEGKNKETSSLKQESGTSIAKESGLQFYKSVGMRGRSSTRKNVLHGSDDLQFLSRSTLLPELRARSADSRIDGKASEKFGTDDLDTIFKRAAKEIEESSQESMWSSAQRCGNFKSVGDVLDSLLSDTEETYGIEISDGFVWALKSAIQQAVTEPDLYQVIQALHDEKIIQEASVFNEGNIPSDLIEAIRSTSLPPGVSVESLAIKSDKSEMRELTVEEQPAVDRMVPSPLEIQSIRAAAKLGDAMKTLESETLHSETSWGKLSNHANNLGVAGDDVSSIGLWSVSYPTMNSWNSGEKESHREVTNQNEETSNAGFHREKKRRAERKLNESLAGFHGTADDLKDIFNHAKETLDMYSPVPSRKRSTAAKVGDNDYSSNPAMSESEKKADNKSVAWTSPRDAELKELLLAIENDGKSRLDAKLIRALKKANRAIERSKKTVPPAQSQLKQASFGDHLTQEGIEDMLWEARQFLNEDIPTPVKARIVHAANLLRNSCETTFNKAQQASGEDPSSANKIDDLGEMFRAASGHASRMKTSVETQRALSPPEPPNFTAMAEEHAKRRSIDSADKSNTIRSDAEMMSFVANFSDSLVNMGIVGEDDLMKLYENAYAEAPRTNNTDFHGTTVPVSEKSPPVPKFEYLKVESRAFSTGDLKSPPLERRTPILSRFLELNRQELLERTQSGREIPMVSPVTEPTMESASIAEEAKARLIAIAKSMPDLEESYTEENDTPEEKFSMELDQLSNQNADLFSGSNSRMEEASFDTFQELEAILSETKKEYGTELSMDLVAAIKNAANSDVEPDSLHDSVSLLMEHIAMDGEVTSTDEPLHGIAVELGKRLSADSTNETPGSISELIHLLKSKLADSRSKEGAPSTRASKHYLSNLVDKAEIELGFALPTEIANKIRLAYVEADTLRNPTVSWEDLEVLLQQVCQDQDENSWFEIQEAFFRAWDKNNNQSIKHLTSKWGHSSGYFSAVSENEGSISVLMDDPNDIDHLEDIVEEVRRIHGGEVPQEVVDRLKDRLKRNSSGLDYMKDFGESSKSSRFFKYSAQSLNFDYSQSTFSSVASPITTSPMLTQKSSVISAAGELRGLDLIEEVGSQSQSFSSGNQDYDVQSMGELFNKVASKSGHSVSSISSSTDCSGYEYFVDLKSSTDRSTDCNSSGQAVPPDVHSAPTSFVVPSGRRRMERSHSVQSIQSTHSVTVNKNFGPELLRELEKKYTGPIPTELMQVLTHSVTIPFSMNSDEDLSIIFHEYDEICHKTLPADLVLVLREASVSLRNASNSSRSRRRLIRQSSGSFRSTSRSSGMPSISETEDTIPATRKISQPEIILADIKTDHPARSFRTGNSAVSRTDSADPGLSHFEPGFDTTGFGGIDRSSHSTNSDESMSLESVQHNIVLQKREPKITSPSTLFNESEATQLASNLLVQRRAVDLQIDLGTVHSSTPSMDSTIEEFAELDGSGHTGIKLSSHVLDKSDSVSTLGTDGQSFSDQGGGMTISDSTANISSVSRTSTLPSRRLPIGLDWSPPLNGVESDDLGVIFAAAAQRMS
ncbi:hypothetical protein IV203_032042 [Nitzschia inconspicua]|uniref:Uncharacterized protein n=1 Tax=Nitzschia inconspicua TaxID=303405 RepID=A0A9K3Q5N6_9STRA|nr:hypothetical protein IV203_032042 [Nitzschia inconspicua]